MGLDKVKCGLKALRVIGFSSKFVINWIPLMDPWYIRANMTVT